MEGRQMHILLSERMEGRPEGGRRAKETALSP